MDDRKKCELLIFLTFYVIFIGLMVPVGGEGAEDHSALHDCEARRARAARAAPR